MNISSSDFHGVKRVTITGPQLKRCQDIDHAYMVTTILVWAEDGSTHNITLFSDEKGPEISLDIKPRTA